jgi:hypothetical protein
MLNQRCRWMQTAANVTGLWFSRTGWRLERTAQRLSAVLISAVLLCACDGSGRPPTAPSVFVPVVIASPPIAPPPIAATPGVTYTLFGTVFEVTSTGRIPIEGAGLYCDGCGSPVGHTSTYTDADGFYSFAWSPNGPVPLLVGKDGYDVVGKPKQPIVAIVNGDTRFDIELVRR